MNLFNTTYALLLVSAVIFCLSSTSSAASSSDAPSSEHDVHILHPHRRLNSKTSKALLFSKTSKAYHSSAATQLSDTPASATQDTPASSNSNGSTNYYYHPSINKRFFMFSKGGKMFKSTKTLKQNHTSNKSSSTIDTSFPDTAAALSFSLSMSHDMSMSFDNDGSDFFFLPDDVIQEFGRVVSKSGKKSSKSVSKSKTSK